MQPSVSVVHLVWIPYEIELFKNFVDSYHTFRAGYPHQLIIVFNGISNEKETISYQSYITEVGLKYEPYFYKKGQDLEVYRWIAGELRSDNILFLNSYSRFLANDWLLKFVNVSADKSIGLIGATGSWQSYYSTILQTKSWSWSKKKSFGNNIAHFKLLLKALLWWRMYFKPFPNPHIRTNAFFICRDTFLKIRYKNPNLKFDAYRIESGKHSITNQVKKTGLKVLLVDKHGELYDEKSWKKANVFWTQEQGNLLIADNQTELYNRADISQKKRLERLAWG